MNALATRIANLIEAQGPLSVAQFMTIALHDPQDGYYATRDPLGRMGDFITAPEVSQMFGELIGLFIAQSWVDQGSYEKFQLVELGPGRGTLMSDVLRAVRGVPGFIDACEVVMIEQSPALRQVQEGALANAPAPVRWLPQIDASIADQPLFLIANEFFDALPIHQYVLTERGWCERMVTVADGKLAFAVSPMPMRELSQRMPAEQGELGQVIEMSPGAFALTGEISRIIAANGGTALIVDYGYGRAGFGETLQAVAQHKYVGILDEPGDADLSAHVDFPTLAGAVQNAGAKAFGPIAQRKLLAALGIDARAAQLSQANPGEAENIARAHERLMDTKAMGQLFKALAIAPADGPTPPGF